MVSRGILWSRFYFLPLGLRFFCIAFAGWAFWSYQEYSGPTLLTALERTASRQAAGESEVSKVHNLKLALKSRVTVFGALFIFAYQGAEVSISAWVISFLINYRDGDPASVGYVTAGFWVSPPLPFTSLRVLGIGTRGPKIHLVHIRLHANLLLGWYNPRPFRPHTSRPPHRRKEIRHLPNHRLHGTPTPRLASSQPHRQCGCRLCPWSAHRPRVSLRANHIYETLSPPYPDHGYWIYCGCG